jgi:pilus assembly protein Flp/PilA
LTAGLVDADETTGTLEDGGEKRFDRNLLFALILCQSKSKPIHGERDPVSCLGSISMLKRSTVIRRAGADREEGATMVEYALMLAFIAIVCFSAVQSLGVSVKGVFPSVSASL